MRPIIGIITRKGKSDTGKNIKIVYDDIISSIIKSGGIPIGIDNNNIDNYLNICNGFILQGGDDIDKNNINILKILYEKDIPVLGICLGMQEMGIFKDGLLVDINGHLDNKLHKININKDSLLYNIINKDTILVNSRHKSVINKTNLYVSGISFDNYIEAIEDNNKGFFLGIQWHPENMYDSDIDAKKIFDYFIKICS